MGVRYMQDDDYLLRRQQIEGNDIIPTEDLEVLYQSKANKKFPLIPFAPYVWIHQLGENSYDSAKIEYKIEKIEAKYDRKIDKYQEKTDKVDRLKRNKSKKVEKKIRDLQDGNILMRWGEPVSVYNEELIK